MSTLAIEQRLTELWERPKTVRGWFATVDHKDLGIRYVVTAFVFLLVGGVEALLMRIQLARPENTILGPESYDQIFSMHGITMIFWYAAPILSGFAVYLVPLMIGARDMAFPRLMPSPTGHICYPAYCFTSLQPLVRHLTVDGSLTCLIQAFSFLRAMGWTFTLSRLSFLRSRRPVVR